MPRLEMSWAEDNTVSNVGSHILDTPAGLVAGYMWRSFSNKSLVDVAIKALGNYLKVL